MEQAFIKDTSKTVAVSPQPPRFPPVGLACRMHMLVLWPRALDATTAAASAAVAATLHTSKPSAVGTSCVPLDAGAVQVLIALCLSPHLAAALVRAYCRSTSRSRSRASARTSRSAASPATCWARASRRRLPTLLLRWRRRPAASSERPRPRPIACVGTPNPLRRPPRWAGEPFCALEY